MPRQAIASASRLLKQVASSQRPFQTHSSIAVKPALPVWPAHSTSANNFQALVKDIGDILGPSFGINSDECDVEALMSRMRLYNSSPSEWASYAFQDLSIPYTRNLVSRGNGQANLVLLVWNPLKGSPIHDHGNSHCIMKVLAGCLTEELYEYPKLADGTASDKLLLWRETRQQTNDVGYMSDRLGVHRIYNPSAAQPAVSLHLYTPPKVELFGCNIWNAKGERKAVPSCIFHSTYGVRS